MTMEVTPDYKDNGMVFGKALNSVMNHFYKFELTKKDHTGVSKVTITIKNIKIK